MLYIVTEDANSARDFWSVAASIYMEPGTYEIVPLPNGQGGNTTLKKQVKTVLSKAKRGDQLFIAFDNIGNTRFFNPADFILSISAQCGGKGIAFQYSRYYCFEEIYLSYSEVLNMSHSKYRDTLKYVQDCINRHKEYFPVGAQNPNVERFMVESGYRISNKEQFANVLLVEATNSINGYFQITKKQGTLNGKGQCWVYGCDRIQKSMMEQQIHNMCECTCEYSCKMCDARQKLEDLRQKSIYSGWEIAKETESTMK